MAATTSTRQPLLADTRVDRIVTQTLSHIILLMFVVVMVFPVLWMVLASLKTSSDFANNLWGLPSTLTFENYTTAWERANLGRAFLNSIIIAASSVMIVLMASTLAGYALARFRLRYGLVIFVLFVVTMQVPVPIIPMYVMLARLKLTDTYLGVILPTVAEGLPLSIFIFRAFFRQVPSDLIEAGIVDGCSRWGAFWRIVLPISGPAIATVAILQFLNAWNSFFLPLIVLRSPEMATIPVSIQAFSYQFGRVDWQPVFASLSVGSIPMIVLYLTLQRWFIQGLTAGAIKG
ncbi:MAG: carbohydrate ABC transporter permease [Burkholderiales bacterium]|nr:carbohydrate ABC transporter permease [Anaerolineae bacterium]